MISVRDLFRIFSNRDSSSSSLPGSYSRSASVRFILLSFILSLTTSHGASSLILILFAIIGIYESGFKYDTKFQKTNDMCSLNNWIHFHFILQPMLGLCSSGTG